MDGVIYHGNRLLDGAEEFLDWLKANNKHYLFLTNSGQYTPRELQQKLARLGLDVDESLLPRGDQPPKVVWPPRFHSEM